MCIRDSYRQNIHLSKRYVLSKIVFVNIEDIFSIYLIITPVSYTHLDVYKRQRIYRFLSQSLQFLFLLQIINPKPNFDSLQQMLNHLCVTAHRNSLIPVSYTHLDVYKRQLSTLTLKTSLESVSYSSHAPRFGITVHE